MLRKRVILNLDGYISLHMGGDIFTDKDWDPNLRGMTLVDTQPLLGWGDWETLERWEDNDGGIHHFFVKQ